jgi:hypothetical protein
MAGGAPGSVRQRSHDYESKASEMKELARQVHEPAARVELITLALGYELLAASLRNWRSAR